MRYWTRLPFQLAGEIMERQQPEDLPVDYMQLRRLKETGFRIPHNTFLKACFRCHGDLHLDVLMRALENVIARHEALSNTFHETASGFVQRRKIIKNLEVHLSAGKASAPGPSGRNPFYRPFDLRSGPFLRVRLARETPEARDFELEFAVENFVADGYSLKLILGEVSQSYNQILNGTYLRQDPAFQQSEYACWQRSEFTPFRMQSIYDAWASQLRRDKLDSRPYAVDSASMWQSPRMTCHVRRVLDTAWVRNFRAWANTQRATAFLAASALYGYCLARTEAVDDAIFFTTVSGRTRKEHFGLVGDLANTLPLRLTPKRAPESLNEWVTEAKRAVAFALDYQVLPLSMIHDELRNRPGDYVDLGSLSFFTLKEPLRLALSGVSSSEIDGPPEADAVLPHSSRLKVAVEESRLDTIFNPDKITRQAVELLHDHIAQVKFPEVITASGGSPGRLPGDKLEVRIDVEDYEPRGLSRRGDQ